MTPFSRRRQQIIEHQLAEERRGFISLVTMVETVWVLDRVYDLSNHEIAAAVERILQANILLVQNEHSEAVAYHPFQWPKYAHTGK